MFDIPTITEDDYKDATDKFESLEHNKISKYGSKVAVLSGSVIGTCGAPTVATIAGANSIPIVTTVASSLGVTCIAATPIGWFLGAALITGGIAYGLSKLILSGGEMEMEKVKMINNFKNRREQ